MLKKIAVFFILIIICLLITPKEKFADINTTLVIVEEVENGEFILEGSPVSDGIFDALWEREDFIFFDMKIREPIPVIYNELDIKPYLNIAKQAGADSILLIKFHYNCELDGNRLRLKINDVFYNLYSIKNLTSIKSGKKDIKMDRPIEQKDKYRLLNKLGNKFLNEIYN